MNKTLIAIIGAALTTLSCAAQEKTIDFENTTGYRGIDVYDCWENSPFRDGRLKGNVMVTENPDKGSDNGSEKVLGAQRSRYGSNTFGVRIDLAEPFELTKELKYVHVLLHRPVGGRVMLVGLGHFRDFPDQDRHVEQFWQLSSTEIEPGRWGDAVFAIKGSGDIDINSLVIVPECESPHNMTEDFLFYVDDITVNDSDRPRIINEDYPIWAGDKKTTLADTSGGRVTSTVGLTGKSGAQTIATGQPDDKKLYHLITDRRFSARAGETVRPTIDATGTGLNFAVYLDRANDGRFEDTDLIGRWNEDEEAPEYKLPADMKPGIYRLRYIADTEPAEAGGHSTPQSNTARQGGAITDVMLNIAGKTITLNDHQLNGEVLAADGRKLNALKAPAGKQFKVRMNPEAGFNHKGMTIKSGYFEGDSIVHGNPQYITVEIPAFIGNEFTIPAELTDANLLINGNMVEAGKE